MLPGGGDCLVRGRSIHVKVNADKRTNEEEGEEDDDDDEEEEQVERG